ncbi:MAG: hypothetical protein IIY58_03805 [Aeriscardovia sp.]|nr:hypothetical protein [Aeriscardovia sp.]
MRHPGHKPGERKKKKGEEKKMMNDEKKRIQEVLEAIYALFIQLLTINY